MSHAQKSALFGAPSDQQSGAGLGSTSSGSKPVSKTAGMTFGVFNNINSVSDTIKKKNIEDAKRCVALAEGNLKTTFLQWKPDYIAAAPQFERASGFYRTAEEYELARELMRRCAECHDSAGSYPASAVAYTKSAALAEEQSLFTEAMDLHVKASERWGLAGELAKYADSYLKAGNLAVKGGSTRSKAAELYSKAIKVALPPDMTTRDQLKTLHPQVNEIVRQVFSFYLAEDRLRDAYELGLRAVSLLQAQDMESSACKMMGNIILLLLALGDTVAADKQFLEYLGNNKFLKSTECRLTEEYLMAFKFTDLDKLDAAQKNSDNYVFEREIQQVCKQLSLRANKKGESHSSMSMPEPSMSNVAVSSKKPDDANRAALFGAPKRKDTAPLPPTETVLDTSEDAETDLRAQLDAVEISEGVEDSTPEPELVPEPEPEPEPEPKPEEDEDEIDLC